MARYYYVYILTNKSHHVLYIGVTNNLLRRVWEHRNHLHGFTGLYRVHKLVYYEVCDRIEDALAREKQLKHWNRAWKERLVNEFNSEWKDLYLEMIS